jgi:hypothetical protein
VTANDVRPSAALLAAAGFEQETSFRRAFSYSSIIDGSDDPSVSPHRMRQKMRKVIVSTYVTLDGRVDEVQDWVVPYDDDAAAK